MILQRGNEKYIISKSFTFKNQECNSKNKFPPILCIACITQELRKIQKWQKSKTLWGYNVSPSWHFLYELEKDGSPKNISSRTYYAPATCLPIKHTHQNKLTPILQLMYILVPRKNVIIRDSLKWHCSNLLN